MRVGFSATLARNNSLTVLVPSRISFPRWFTESKEGELDESLATTYVDGSFSSIIETYGQLSPKTRVNKSKARKHALSRQRGTNVQDSKKILGKFHPLKACNQSLLTRFENCTPCDSEIDTCWVQPGNSWPNSKRSCSNCLSN